MIDSGAVTYGGDWVVNPSGGLISKGHPLGAPGLAQCAELNWQLRDMAADRQVVDAKLALQHNLGLGGACVVAMYEKAALYPLPSSFRRRLDTPRQVGSTPKGVGEGQARVAMPPSTGRITPVT